MKKLYFFIAMFLLISSSLFAQVSINTDNSVANPSSMLDVKSTSKGFFASKSGFVCCRCCQSCDFAGHRIICL